MKPRHAAALALVGWYLIAPPTALKKSKDIEIRSDAPLHEWMKLGSYDSVKDCESAKATLTAKHRLHGESLEQTKQNLRIQNFWTFAQEFSLCIASDDPRLKEK